jgi:photosystem II stability/assembly factor-like uncharacterized protein
VRRILPSVRLHAIHAAFGLLAILAGSAAAQSPFDGLKFRSIGPAVMGGRVHAIAVDPRDNAVIYVGAASGGMWKTTNKGTTWAPVFEGQADNTFGDIAISPVDSRIVWAGTGEQQNRQSSSWGGGIYKSADAGATWTFLGLKSSASISKVIAHPSDANVAYVAAVGNLWKANAERGVFKTTDGGKSWQKILYVDTLTGATDLVMDPRDPNVLYAAMYYRLRTAYGFNGGGPSSGLYKSTDGGASWKKIEAGLPAGDKGRIGIALARSNPNILVITLEHQNGGVFRSEDAGATWRRMSGANPRPMYYSAPIIDPTTDQRIWLMNVQPMKSEDGGANFETMPNSPTYDLGLKDDHHALWIDPRDNRHLLLGGDGGLHESFDMGYTYNRVNLFAVGQFYRIAVDDRDPYWVYGGMQDAHSWMGPSATNHWLGILNADWKQIGFSDGTGQAVDKAGARFVYSTSSGGSISRVDAFTGDRIEIQPVPPQGESYRYDWTAPVLASKHTAGTVYLGANKLLISKDYGSTWTATKDLTKNINRDTLRMAGVLNSAITLSRNDGDTYSEIASVAESPLDPLVLWVGTDDGNLQLSKDGGKTWAELSANLGAPAMSFIDRIVASGAAKGTAYVSVDNHRSGDFTPFIFRTTDFGKTFTRVTDGLPDGAPVRSIVEYPGKAHVLFAGTERFLYYTTDSARHWTRVAANLPTTRYDDLIVHPRTKDLVIGTHGRSIWILDDATPFAEWTSTLAAKPATLFPVRRATLTYYWQDVSTAAHNFYAAENPAEGATFTYHLAKASPSVKFTVTNAAGKVVRELTGPGTAGVLQRINWDLRYAPPAGGGFAFGGGGEEAGGPPAEAGAGGRGGRGGRGGGRTDMRPPLPIPAHNIGARGTYVAPGTYTVTMEVDGAKETRTFEVRSDPTTPVTAADHKARESFLLEVADVQARLTARTTEFRAKLTAATGDEQARLTALAQKLGIGVGAGGRGGRGGRGGGGIAAALGGLAGQFNGSGVRHTTMQGPTGTQKAVLAEAKKVLAALDAELKPAPAAKKK